MRGRFKFLFAAITTAILLLVMLQNTADVELRFLFWRIEMPQLLMVPMLLLLGFVSGYACCKWIERRPAKD